MYSRMVDFEKEQNRIKNIGVPDCIMAVKLDSFRLGENLQNRVL